MLPIWSASSHDSKHSECVNPGGGAGGDTGGDAGRTSQSCSSES